MPPLALDPSLTHNNVQFAYIFRTFFGSARHDVRSSFIRAYMQRSGNSS